MADSTLDTGGAERVVTAVGEGSPDEQVDAERSDEAEAARVRDLGRAHARAPTPRAHAQAAVARWN